jgi:hypothetical protein
MSGLAEVGTARKIGRNDPCPCGSGQKYKRRCGKADPSSYRRQIAQTSSRFNRQAPTVRHDL